MKKFMTLILILSSTTLFARNIKGLDPNEVDDFDYCAKSLMNLSFEEVNTYPNFREMFFRGGNLDNKLFHNFISSMYYYDEYQADNSILVSGTLRDTKKAKITNSVVSNMTFTGDISKIDFTGSCLVNVRFPKETSFWTKRRIRSQAFYYKNLEFKHEWEPRD